MSDWRSCSPSCRRADPVPLTRRSAARAPGTKPEEMAMSITSTTTGRVDGETGGTHSAHSARTNRALWAAQVLLAAVFAFAAMPKLAGAHSAVAMVGQIRAGLAAAGLAADMAGASIINSAVLHSAAVALTIPLCAALALLARARWEHVTKFLAARTGRDPPARSPIPRHGPPLVRAEASGGPRRRGVP